MTEQVRSNLMHNIQTALLSLCTLAASGCFVLLWSLNNFETTQTEKDREYENDIVTITAEFNVVSKELVEVEKQQIAEDARISILENKK